MRRQLVTATLAVLAFSVLLGLVYPLVVTGVSQVAFNHAANGSQIVRDGKLVGSELVGADYAKHKELFQSRPSVTGNSATATYFANRGPNQAATRDMTRQHLTAYLALNAPYDTGLTASDVPVDAVTFSASGVDPQISPADAAIQAHRVAALQHMPLAQVQRLIDEHSDGRFLGVFGEPGVNVATLNAALESR
jgi:K+-transporting ATPase ATPase C chain